jgi:hypothetical protein
VENSKVKLTCSKAQCKVKMTKENLVKHEAECEFRIVPCSATKCEMIISFRQIGEHVKTHTDLKTCKNRSVKLQIRKKENSDSDSADFPLLSWEHRHSGIQFYPQIVKRDGVWYFWVKIKGGLCAASQWKFTAKTENKDTGHRMEFSGPVSPVDLSVAEVIETSDCLMMNQKCMEKLNRCDFEVFK